MNKLFWVISLLLVIVFGSIIIFACQTGDDDDNNGVDVTVGDPDKLVDNLEADEFVVKEGGAGFFNMISKCCMPAEDPKLPSCFGFNPDAPYVASYIPNANGQDEPNAAGLSDATGTYSAAYRLGSNEAVVIVGKTPPEVTYFSYVPYLFIRYDATIENYVKIFATMTDTINLMNIKTTGTPNGKQGDPFDKDMMMIVTADKETDRLVRLAAVKAGYSESIINTMIIPADIARMGLDLGRDEFMLLNRMALPPDDADAQKKFQDYLETPAIRVFRVSPGSDATDPFAAPAVTSRTSGSNENSYAESVAALRQAILDKYSDYAAEEYETKLWIPEGRDCVEQNMECIGENHDTIYLRMPGSTTDYPVAGPKLFTLSDDPNDFLMVYGVNHVKAGKSVYHSVSIYGNERLNGIITLTNRIFEGSAEAYLPEDDPNADDLFVVKVARHCAAEETDPCLEVPVGSCPVDDMEDYGATLDQELFLVIRAYANPTTHVGPSPEEVIFDKTIHFTGK